MVVPEDLGDSAQNGDQDRVFAWLDAGGDINDADPQGFTNVARLLRMWEH